MARANPDIIKEFETLQLHAYNDGYGTWTIGWGETGPVGGVKPGPGMTITEAEADNALEIRVQGLEQAVEKLLTRPMDQGPWDAIISLAYNAGLSAAKSVLDFYEKGDTLGALTELGKFRKAGVPLQTSDGLVNRRIREIIRWTAGL